jgi:hypothetical protein
MTSNPIPNPNPLTDDEKRVLGLGVDKLATRYWQLEGREDLKRKVSVNLNPNPTTNPILLEVIG